MELPVLNMEGKETGENFLMNEEIFSIEPNTHTVYLDVKRCRAHIRKGTHKTKQRGEVKGSTRKLKKQKGTGTARAGSAKSPIRRGGGNAFGPTPKKYRMKINKKVKALARASVLSMKAKENDIMILQDVVFEKPNVKQYIQLLKNLQVENKKTLFITSETDKNMYLSSRNIDRTNVLPLNNINTYVLLDVDKIVFLKNALERMQ